MEHTVIANVYDVTLFEDLGNGQTKLPASSRRLTCNRLWPRNIELN